MPRNSKLAPLWITIALVVAVAIYSARKTHSSGLGPAPDFKLPLLNGQELQLSSFRGKVVLLDFWATWCDPCREETPHLVDLQNRYADRGLQVIGISMDDTPDPVRNFYQQFHVNYPVVMGTAKIGEQYGGVLGLPIAFFIGRDGKIYAKKMGAQSPESIEQEVKKLL